MPEINLPSILIGGGITAALGFTGAMVNGWWTRRQNGIYDFQKSIADIFSKLFGGRMDYQQFHSDTLCAVAAAVCRVEFFLFPWEKVRLQNAWNEYQGCRHQLDTTVLEFLEEPCNPAYMVIRERLDALVRATNLIHFPIGD